MKKLLHIALFLSLIFYKIVTPNSVHALFCDPPISGAWSVTSNCVLYDNVNGTALGNTTLSNNSTITLHNGKTLAWYPGQSIVISNGSHIIINTGAKIDQNYLCVKESGTNSNYAEALTATDPRTGTSLYLGLNQITASTGTNPGDSTMLGSYPFENCSGTTISDTTSTNHGTLSLGAGGTTTAGTCSPVAGAWGAGATGITGASISLDGTDDYVTIPNNRSGETSASVAFWYKANRVGNGGGSNYSADLIQHTNFANLGYWIEWRNNGSLEFSVASQGGLLGTTIATTLDTTSWHHVAIVVISNGTSAAYFDGKLSNTLATGAWSNYTGNLLVGSGQTGTNSTTAYNQFFGGKIDDLRVYNRAITAREVSALAGLPNPIAKYCPLGYKRRETFVSKDYVDLSTLGTVNLTTPYRWFLNLGFAVSGITTPNGAGYTEPGAPSAPVKTNDANLIVCTGANAPYSCSVTTTPADGGNLIAESKVGVGIANANDVFESYGASWRAKFGNATNYLTLSGNQLASNGTALLLNSTNANNVYLAAGGGKVGIGSLAQAPRYNLEVNNQITEKAAYDANVNMGSYEIGVTKLGANSSILSPYRLCSGNASGDCSSTGGTVLTDNSITTWGSLNWYQGTQIQMLNANYLNQYPSSVAMPSVGTGLYIANGSAYSFAGYVYGEYTQNFGLLTNGGSWAYRINYPNNYTWMTGRLGIGASGSFGSYVNALNTTQTSGTASLNVGLSIYGPIGSGAQVFVQGSNGALIGTNSVNRNYDSAINYYRWNGSAFSSYWKFGLFGGYDDFWIYNSTYGTSLRSYLSNGDLEVFGNLMSFPGRATTDGFYTRHSCCSADTWFRIVKGNAVNTYHDVAAGRLYASAAIRFDIAEVAPVKSSDNLVLGNLVSIDPDTAVQLHKSDSAYDHKLIGIVSHINTASMVIGGDTGPEKLLDSKDKAPIALSGRVVTQVNLQNGPIAIGDAITASDSQGVGMKAIRAGTTISQAMDNFDGSSVNSQGVLKIIKGLHELIKNEIPGSKPAKELQDTIDLLQLPLPKGTGRIISFVNPEFYQPNNQNQSIVDMLNKQQEEIKSLTETINQLSAK